MEKPMMDRVKECVEIVRALEEHGVTREFPGRIELDKRIQEYVKTGEPWAGTILFPELHRIGEVILPRRKHVVASINLRFVPFDNGQGSVKVAKSK